MIAKAPDRNVCYGRLVRIFAFLTDHVDVTKYSHFGI